MGLSLIARQAPADPPRSVSAGLKISALLGGRGAQGAWLLLFLALPGIWYILTSDSVDPFHNFHFWGETKKTTGYVSSLIEGKREYFENGLYGMATERVEIRGIHYWYTGPGNITYTGTAWGLKHNYHNRYADVAATVPVEYVADRPGISRVKGLKREEHGTQAILAGVFWIAVAAGGLALLVILGTLAHGLGVVGLLSKGHVTTGVLGSIEPIGMGKLIHLRKLHYRFQAGHEDRWFCTYSTRVDDEMPHGQEPVLIHPTKTETGLPLSHVPGEVILEQDGGYSEGEFNAYKFLLLPAICLVGYGWFALHYMGLYEAPWESLF